MKTSIVLLILYGSWFSNILVSGSTFLNDYLLEHTGNDDVINLEVMSWLIMNNQAGIFLSPHMHSSHELS